MLETIIIWGAIMITFFALIGIILIVYFIFKIFKRKTKFYDFKNSHDKMRENKYNLPKGVL